MSNIKAGEIAVVKITGEPVFVLAISDASTRHYTGEYGVTETGGEDYDKPIYQIIPGPTAVCRTASSGSNGTYFHVKTFTLLELDTLEDQKKRFLAEREELLGKFTPTNGSTTPNTNLGFSDN